MLARRRRPYHRVAYLAAGAIVVAVLSACGGSDDARTTPTATSMSSPTDVAAPLLFDPARGYEIAHNAMLGPADLPGPGWTVADDDDFVTQFEPIFGPDGNPSQTPACIAYPTSLDSSKELLRVNIADTTTNYGAQVMGLGRAARRLDLRLGSTELAVATVVVQVAVYRGTDAPSRAETALRDALPAWQECTKDQIRDDANRGGFLVEQLDLPPTAATPPHDGPAIAVAFTISRNGQTLEGRREFYFWRNDNVLAFVAFSATKGMLTAKLAASVLEQTKARLNAWAR